MEKISRSALIPFSCEKMFHLVNDVEKYSEFLPYCKSSVIIKSAPQKIVARLLVAKGVIEKSFSTENILVPCQRIQMRLVDGPFKHLQGEWIFTPLSDQACKIELNLQFEFANQLSALAFAKIFNQLVEKMVAAFCQRAEKIYGSTA